MANKFTTRKCKDCTNTFTASHQKIYCNDCKKSRAKESYKNNNNKYKEKYKNKSLDKVQEAKENFIKINPKGTTLLPKEFDKISNLPTRSYVKRFNTNWLGVLELFNKCEEYERMLLEEFEKFILKTGSYDGDKFCSSIGIKYRQVKHFNFKSIKSKLDIKEHTITKNVLEKDFYNILKINGGEPPYCSDEFNRLSKYSMYSYINIFCLSEGNYYEKILKMFLDVDYADEILKEGKNAINKNISIGRLLHSDADLKNNFVSTVERLKEEFEMIPNAVDFETFTEISLVVYKERLKTYSYYNILEIYGYKGYIKSSKAELTTIKNFENILKITSQQQKTFDWLLSTKRYSLKCDAYFEKYSLIVEYDGIQHFEPVDFFGGEENFKAIVERDKIKNTLIPQHNLTLLRIAYDEPYHDSDFLKFRLIEHGIVPPNHTVIADSNIAIKSAS